MELEAMGEHSRGTPARVRGIAGPVLRSGPYPRSLMFQVKKLRANQVSWNFDPGIPLGWIGVGEISRVG